MHFTKWRISKKLHFNDTPLGEIQLSHDFIQRIDKGNVLRFEDCVYNFSINGPREGRPKITIITIMIIKLKLIKFINFLKMYLLMKS